MMFYNGAGWPRNKYKASRKIMRLDAARYLSYVKRIFITYPWQSPHDTTARRYATMLFMQHLYVQKIRLDFLCLCADIISFEAQHSNARQNFRWNCTNIEEIIPFALGLLPQTQQLYIGDHVCEPRDVDDPFSSRVRKGDEWMAFDGISEFTLWEITNHEAVVGNKHQGLSQLRMTRNPGPMHYSLQLNIHLISSNRLLTELTRNGFGITLRECMRARMRLDPVFHTSASAIDPTINQTSQVALWTTEARCDNCHHCLLC